VDVSTSDDVEAALKDLFAKNSPEFYLGDCLDVISQHPEWEAKMTLVLLDPPFGVLPETHDTQIPAKVIMELCNFLLKPQGVYLLRIS
jgi:predicted RNA methylase